LSECGVEVIASDREPIFVDYMRSHGLDALVVDASDIGSSGLGAQKNILTQGLAPLISPDLEIVENCYRSIHGALEPSGRAIVVIPRGDPRRYSRYYLHRPILDRLPLATVVAFRHQAIPAKWYRRLPSWVTWILDQTIGRLVGIRDVIVLERTT
jgi:hypothetical protein